MSRRNKRKRRKPIVPSHCLSSSTSSQAVQGPDASASTKKRTRRKKKKKMASRVGGGDRDAPPGGAEPEFSSTAQSQEVVSSFHTLNKRLDQVIRSTTLSPSEREHRLASLKEQQAALGGLERYQRASMFGASTDANARFCSATWVLQELASIASAHGASDGEGLVGDALELLDVGAIDNQYKDHSHVVRVVPIDLNPCDASVRKADFFPFAKEHIASRSPPFGGIVLSLVINFVGSPRERGSMLALCAHPGLLKRNGHLFIVLPLACTENSRYMSYRRFTRMLKFLGFELESYKKTARLALWRFRLADAREWYVPRTDSFEYGRAYPRKLVRGGKSRNNFCIVLRSSSSNGGEG